MTDRRRVLVILMVMAGAALAVAAATFGLLYQAAFEQERQRLVEMVRSQARLVEAVARFNKGLAARNGLKTSAVSATLRQIADAHGRYEGVGETGEFTLSKRESDRIIFLLSHRHYDLDQPKPVPWDSELAEPARRALKGQSGSLVGLDYRGVKVLAAHEPVAELNLGMVAKIDMSEIRAPFIRAAEASALGAVILIGLGGLLVRGLTNPILMREQAGEALRASRERLCDFVDAATDWFWETDAQLRYTYVSSRFQQVTGIAVEKALGRSKQELLELYLADPEALVSEKWRRINELIQARRTYRDIELSWGCPDGSVKVFLHYGKPYFGPEGAFCGYRGAAIEITGRKEAEREIQKTRDELEKKLAARVAELRATQHALIRKERLAAMGQLTATVAHELRNPLGAILNSVAVVRLKTADLRHELQRSLDRIDRSVARCDRIVTELLDFVRARGLQPEPTDLDRWLSTVIEELDIPDRVTVRRNLRLAGLEVSFDREALRRALVNLADNACQAMTHGNAWGSARSAKYLTFETRLHGGRVEIEIADTGPGIPGDILPQVLEPLFSTRQGGTGLGLPTVQHIMEDHGGGLEINSVQELGTRVILWLPRREDSGDNPE